MGSEFAIKIGISNPAFQTPARGADGPWAAPEGVATTFELRPLADGVVSDVQREPLAWGGQVPPFPAVLSFDWKTESAHFNRPGEVVRAVFRLAEECLSRDPNGVYFDISRALTHGMARTDALTFAGCAALRRLPEGQDLIDIVPIPGGGWHAAAFWQSNVSVVLASVPLWEWKGDKYHIWVNGHWWGLEVWLNKALTRALIEDLRAGEAAGFGIAGYGIELGNAYAFLAGIIAAALSHLGAESLDKLETCNGINVKVPIIGVTTVSSA